MKDSESAGNTKYFEALGLRSGATLSEIKKNARALLLKFHPDLNPNNRAYCEDRTKTIIEAYRALLNLKKREDAAPPAGDGRTATAGEGTFEALVFEIANRAFALPTRYVREIVRVKDGRLDNIGLVSEAFPYVAGVFSRGGDVTMLWNLHAQLGLRETPISSRFEKNKVVVVDVDDSAVSFLVDGVIGIMAQRMNSLLSPGAAGDVKSDYLDGVLATEDRRIGLLNMRNILYAQSPDGNADV